MTAAVPVPAEERRPRYVPILRGKEGEFGALQELDAVLRDDVLPLIEVPPIPMDHVNQRPAKTVAAHVANVAARIRNAWGADRALLLDLPAFRAEQSPSVEETAIWRVLGDCRANQLRVIPVIVPDMSLAYHSAAVQHAAACSEGLCLRVTAADIGSMRDPESAILTMVEASGGDATTMDLLVDFGTLDPDLGRTMLIARAVLAEIPSGIDWRRIIIASASFPEDLSEVDAETMQHLPRREWEFWERVLERPGALRGRELLFSDYGIANPLLKDLDPRTMRMSASIRYTLERHWLVVKGRNVRQYGYEQYFDLAKRIVESPDFAGKDASWGDAYLEGCAQRIVGPGNATTWRKVGTNHHLELTTRQLIRTR